MDFVAVILFTKQLFYLECFVLFQIKPQPGVNHKKAFNVAFQSSKN